MPSWKKCFEFESGREAASCFLSELKAARLDALADAEGWLPIVLVIERLGKYLRGERLATLGKARQELSELATCGMQSLSAESSSAITHEALVRYVAEGRNEEFHGGAAARRFAHHCLELCMRLEDGLKTFMSQIKLRDVMAPNPICVASWQPIYHARRLMLENSFTWLPLMIDGKTTGQVISDYSLVVYIAQCRERFDKTIKAATLNDATPRLSPEPVEVFYENDDIDEAVVEALRAKPILVRSHAADQIVGIVTAFDLL